MPAATVILEAFNRFPETTYQGTTCVMRIWYSRSFIAADGSSVNGGPNFYTPVPCTITNSIISVAASTLYVTLNAIDPFPQSIQVFAQFYTNNNTRARDQVFAGNGTPTGWQVYDPDPQTVWSYEDLTIVNQSTAIINPSPLYVSTPAMIAYVNSLAPAPYATVNRAGIGKSDTVPTSTPINDPVFVEIDSARLPSANRYSIVTYGATTISTAAQNATAITAACTAANLVGASISVPLGTFSANSVTINAPVVFESAGAILAPVTGQTITITRSIEADASRHFSNAVAGQGTIAFTNNRVLRSVRAEWWGAVGDNSTDNAVYLNAASSALVTNNISGLGSGFILLGPGIYQIGSLWTIGSTTGGGDGLGQFSGISICGTNGLTGTQLKWTGSTSGQMIKFVRGRHININDIDFQNGVAKGTTIGVWFSGPPNLSEQTSRLIMENCNVNGFHIGIQPGDTAGTAAGELKFIDVVCDSNDYGMWLVSSGNTLVNSIDTCSFLGNTTCGLKVGEGAGDTHVENSGFSGNAADIQFHGGWAPTIAIEKNRFECVAGSAPILNASGTYGIARVANNNFAGTAPTAACIQGPGFWNIENNAFGADSDTAWVVYSGANNASGSLNLKQNRIQNTTAVTTTNPVVFVMETGSTGQVGMKYESRGNHYAIAGVVTKFTDVVAGVVGTDDSGAVVAIQQLKVAANGSGMSGDLLTMGNQVATPNVGYGNRFKAADSGATVQTDMLGGTEGHEITIFFTNGSRTVQNNASQLLAGAANFVGSANDTLSMIKIGSVWYETARSIN